MAHRGQSTAAVRPTLSQGVHGITVAGTDSDGYAASASTRIVIAGGPPTLALDVLAVDELPTTCVRVTIDAQPALDSVALDTVDYSLDGGESWTAMDEGQRRSRFLFRAMVSSIWWREPSMPRGR